MNAKEKNKLAGIFLMIHGGLQALIMVFLVLIYGGMGVAIMAASRRQEDQFAGMVILGVMVGIFVFSLIFILPQLIGGWKMIKEKPNARTWGIIASIVALLGVPLGTAAGVFGLIFLFGDDGKAFYLGGANQQQPMFNQPPPNNWQ